MKPETFSRSFKLLCFIPLGIMIGQTTNALAGPKTYDINLLLNKPHPFAMSPSTAPTVYNPRPVSAGKLRARIRMPPTKLAPTFAMSSDRDASLVINPGADTDNGDYMYDFNRFADHSMSIPLELTALVGMVGALGVLEWDWGSSSFGVQSEGFFGQDTANGGMDKLGHVWSAALISDVLTHRIRRNSADRRGAAVTGSILSMGVMTGIEIFDGIAEQHAFSPQDILANATGAAFSYIRNTVPGVRNKLDYRMEYVPSGNRGAFEPWSDYSGQKYILALKLSGFETISDTSLRFLELQAGYYARGFTLNEKKQGRARQRELYVGIGINLQELFFGRHSEGESTMKTYGRRVFEYVQVPYTYATVAPGAYNY